MTSKTALKRKMFGICFNSCTMEFYINKLALVKQNIVLLNVITVQHIAVTELVPNPAHVMPILGM